MGFTGSTTAQVRFDDARIGADRLMGAEGQGFKIALAALDGGRLGIAACAVGLAQARPGHCRWPRPRSAASSAAPIVEFQGLAFMLADMATGVEAGRALYLAAARRRDRGEPFGKQAAMAKLFCTDMAMRVTTDAVQVLGGYGYVADFPVERYMREAKALQIVEGTNQVQRMVIARHLTRCSRDPAAVGSRPADCRPVDGSPAPPSWWRVRDTVIPVALTDPYSLGERGHGGKIGRLGDVGSEWRDRLVRRAVPAHSRARHLGRESSMRTVLCSTTAGRGAFLLALVAGTVGGSSFASPASAADASAAGGGTHARHASHHRSHGAATGSGAVLGPAVKYVRNADGTIARSADAAHAPPRPPRRRPPRRCCGGRGPASR